MHLETRPLLSPSLGFCIGSNLSGCPAQDPMATFSQGTCASTLRMSCSDRLPFWTAFAGLSGDFLSVPQSTSLKLILYQKLRVPVNVLPPPSSIWYVAGFVLAQFFNWRVEFQRPRWIHPSQEARREKTYVCIERFFFFFFFNVTFFFNQCSN